ncbi:hypothetical protein FKW77_006644 [Venturia effusa]|uniref:ZZ-type domain-containing protein n=1 Tax=Venturia effusa TaxID=50376 RepID=A0A517KWM8_9PEZI|nr:hypothetical protein FKW77_006644 [Venturia effusa]
MASHPPVTLDTPISIKCQIEGQNRKFRLPLGDLTPQVLPVKLRSLLGIGENQAVVFERYSDSAAAYVTLDPTNTHVYKTLLRAAKAKLKLRLRVSVDNPAALPFASAFPDFANFGSETTLHTNNGNGVSIPASTSTPTPQVQTSLESFVRPVSTEPAEAASAAQTTTQKRISTRLSREGFFAELANISRNRELALRIKEAQPAPAHAKESKSAACSWSVFCNACDRPMANEHYHCTICDDGDYDLCATCVKDGAHCPGEGHWLIKRFVSNGQVINSTTEKLTQKSPVVQEPTLGQPEIPGAFTESIVEPAVEEHVDEDEYEPVRTCNSCNQFVTCIDCDDFDLCTACHEGNKHGHHPAHTFKAVAENTISALAERLCAPGRGVKHAALCDGCDKPINGVRHKCLNCPDWDYCSECFKNAKFVHPQHRFAAHYEPIPATRIHAYPSKHVGIYCDGPLCQNKHSYIEGVRYKCAICHDTDFCANCEAYPHNKHNQTHPLIKLKTSVRNVSVTTMGENKTMGDRTTFAKAPVHRAPSNAATQVQTIVDVKPAEATYRPLKEKIEIKDLLAEPIEEKIKVQDLLSSPNEELKSVGPVDVAKLQAQFVRETVPDATLMQPGLRFVQVWTMRNTGSEAWPAGCSVRYTGGDNMLNVEKYAPSAISDIAQATETNVMSRPVEVGEEISFRVTMKAPQSKGTKISYWRLKTADGQAFGHRLWCHINVAAPAVAPVAESSSLPEVSPSFTPATIPTVERNEDVGRPSLQDNFLQTVLQQRVDRRREKELSAEVHKRIDKAMALQHSRVQEERATRNQMLRNLSAEIHAVEVQHKAKVAAAKAAIDAAKIAKKEVEPSELPAPSPSNLEGAAQTIWLLKEHSRRMEEARQQALAHEVEAPSPTSVVEEEAKTKGSGMIFPTLEKESPSSSLHDLAAPSSSVTALESPSPISPAAAESESDIFEDAESVDFVSSDSEAGFCTDDEYDILDASDEDLAS